jgi:hypothetical protein
VRELKKSVLGLAIVTILLFTTFVGCYVKGTTIPGFVKVSTFQGWTVESQNGGGQYNITDDGTIILSTFGGRTVCPSIGLGRDISPVTDFNFSWQVMANQPESFMMSIDDDAGHEVSFQFGHYGAPDFILARSAHPDFMIFAVGNERPEWYTMRLSVYKDPFIVRAEAWDPSEKALGSFSYSDMDDLVFENITSVHFRVWGYAPSDYSVRNIMDPFVNTTLLSISSDSLSVQAGSIVNISGTLTDENHNALPNRSVVLSYSVPGDSSWIPISSEITNENGDYFAQWINSASGTFFLKAEFSGDNNYIGGSNITTLSFLPYVSQQVFTIESNSTVSKLAFNSSSAELSFTVSGESGTTGFVKTTIAKSLISKGTDIKVYLDGNQLNYTVTETDESWVLLFEYSHSTHDVIMYMGTNQSSDPNSPTASPSVLQTSNPSTGASSTQAMETTLPKDVTGSNFPLLYVLAIGIAAVITLLVTLTFALRKHPSSE